MPRGVFVCFNEYQSILDNQIITLKNVHNNFLF